MKKHYRVVANPDLPQGARQEASNRNKFSGQKWSRKKDAKAAMHLLDNPESYIVAECMPVGLPVLERMLGELFKPE